MYKKVLPLALIISSLSTTTFADPHASGNYLEANVGTLYASLSFLGVEFTQFGSFGANINFGHQFLPYFAVETGLTNYGVGSVNAIDIAAKFIMPFSVQNNDFNVFAKLGPSFIYSGHGGAVLPFAGIGAGYAVTSNLDVNLQAQGVSEGFFSLGLLSAGLTYHFS